MGQLKSTAASRLFLRAPSVAAKSIFLIIISIVLMVLDRQGGHLDAVRRTLSVVVYPVQAAVDLPYRFIDWVSENLAARNSLIDENRKLKREQLEMSAALQRLAALETENQRLRELMESSARVPNRILVAELLQVDLDPFRHRVLINKGAGDGAHTGQPIIDAYGVAGQITNVGLFTSDVILITDPGHAIPVEVNRNGLQTVAVGTGNINRLELGFLPNNADIQEGDLLISSGLGGRFPRGYPVGTVSEIVRDPGQAFATTFATPAAALNRSREVLLVWPDEQTAAEDTP